MHILSLRAFPKSGMDGVHGFGELQFGCIQAKQQEGCFTLWACHSQLKVSNTKKRIMESQIFHQAKIQSSKNPLKESKILQDIITYN